MREWCKSWMDGSRPLAVIDTIGALTGAHTSDTGADTSDSLFLNSPAVASTCVLCSSNLTTSTNCYQCAAAGGKVWASGGWGPGHAGEQILWGRWRQGEGLAQEGRARCSRKL